MILKKLIRQFSNLSFFIKLAISYSLLIIISMSIMFYLQFSYLMPTIQNSEIKSELQAFKELTLFTNDNYKKTIQTVIQTYNQNGVIENLKRVNKNINNFYSIDIGTKMNNYLSGVCNLNTNILDFILITNNNMVYQESNRSNRSISPRYDFSKDPFIREIRRTNTKMKVIADNPSRYMVNRSEGTVSFGGNIFNVNNLNDNKSIGTFIINVSAETFKNAYSNIYESLGGNFLIADSDGVIVFSSDNKYLGKKYPYFDKVKYADNEKIFLDKLCIVNSAYLSDSQLTVISTLPNDFAWKKLSGLRNGMLILLIVSLIITILIAAIISNIFNIRIKTLMKYMKKIQNGDLNVKIPTKSQDEIGKLSMMFNEMCLKLSDYVNKVYFAEIERKNFEIAALQSQINPHFIYNTLESIRMKALVEKQYEISDMLLLMGNIFRWNIKIKDKIVRIEDEIDYISSYLELIKFRFGDKLEVKIDVSEDILDFGIPKLLLQPIVENAIVHGITEIEGQGSITILGKLVEDKVEFSIIDNGVGMDSLTLNKVIDYINSENENDEYNNIGNKNVYKRIKLIFGSKYGLSIISNKGEGTTVKIRIPAIKKEVMEKDV